MPSSVTRTARRWAHAANRRAAWMLAGGLLAAVGCGDSADPLLPACATSVGGSAVELNVGSGMTPTFTWSPNCTATRLYVARGDLSFGEPVWHVELASATTGFSSGVVYGNTPRGAIARTGPFALQAGESYVVSLHGTGPTAAVRSFTR